MRADPGLLGSNEAVLQDWEEVARAVIPGNSETMRLMRGGDEFKILVGRTELMTNLSRGSERALGQMGCEHLRDRPNARILIGGLGMGFTLRAALAVLRPASRSCTPPTSPARPPTTRSSSTSQTAPRR